MDGSEETPKRGPVRLILQLLAGAALLALIIVVVNGLSSRPQPQSAGRQAQHPQPAVAAPDQPTTTLTPFRQAEADGASLSIIAAVDQIGIHDAYGTGARLLKTYPLKDDVGMPTTFLATDEAFDTKGATWYEVLLPERPNGSRGWVRGSDVTAEMVPSSIRIYLAEHRLDFYLYGQKTASYSIGVGKNDTPTPLGLYYISTKMRPPRPDTVYGVLALGISGFTENLKNWPGEGQVGIHGTNDPAGIGKDVSHGCIRLRNEDIVRVSNESPLGTPVLIQE